MNKKLIVPLGTIVVGIVVAVVYFLFEAAVRQSTNYVWETLFETDTRRWLVVPLCFVLTMGYFALQHKLDPKSEKGEDHGFGTMPKPTLVNLGKVLLIGFFSLLAGASLGPEAILVPACMIAGAYVGAKILPGKPLAIKLLAGMGFIALFAAFFKSFLIGVLSIFLVSKQAKIKVTPELFGLAAVASASTIITLHFLDSSAFFRLPHYHWHINLATIAAVGLLFFAGFFVTYGVNMLHDAFSKLNKLYAAKESWWLRGAIAGLGLGILYLLGGQLVQFTGNESIEPMLADAATLGVIGLVWIMLIKLLAISWSKTMGYRGGLVFPMVFVASVLVALATMVVKDLNFIYGLLATIAGLIAANSKTKALF
ncbi:MAG: chloride channel protein [Candidatus Saccharimonadales bacterium]